MARDKRAYYNNKSQIFRSRENCQSFFFRVVEWVKLLFFLKKKKTRCVWKTGLTFLTYFRCRWVYYHLLIKISLWSESSFEVVAVLKRTSQSNSLKEYRIYNNTRHKHSEKHFYLSNFTPKVSSSDSRRPLTNHLLTKVIRLKYTKGIINAPRFPIRF